MLYIKNYLESKSQISPHLNKNVNKKTSIIAGAPEEHSYFFLFFIIIYHAHQ